jgi:hypothetical protein
MVAVVVAKRRCRRSISFELHIPPKSV